MNLAVRGDWKIDDFMIIEDNLVRIINLKGVENDRTYSLRISVVDFSSHGTLSVKSSAYSVFSV